MLMAGGSGELYVEGKSKLGAETEGLVVLLSGAGGIALWRTDIRKSLVLLPVPMFLLLVRR